MGVVDWVPRFVDWSVLCLIFGMKTLPVLLVSLPLLVLVSSQPTGEHRDTGLGNGKDTVHKMDIKVRRKRTIPSLPIGNLFVVQVLGTAIRPTNFVLLRVRVKVKEENQRRRRR